MYQSSADFGDSLRLKGKSRKTFDIIMSKKFFFTISLWGGGGGGVGLGGGVRLPGCNPLHIG